MTRGPQHVARRILVIDDDPVSLAIAAVLLEAEGCHVLQAQSGEEALGILSTASAAPDCILSDLLMPTLSGTGLARELRRLAPQAALLAMSANPPESIEGYDGILRKPLTPENLSSILARQPALAPEPQDAPHEEGFSVIDSAVFDRLQSAMNSAALHEVVVAFLNDTRSRIDSMRRADPELMRRQAHTVRGGAAMIGAVQVGIVASMIEAGIDHAGDRLRKLDELEIQLRRAEQFLKQRLPV